MTDSRRDDIDELLGAYALDAIDSGDRAQVESYLGAAPTARAEVDELRETAAMLALITPTDELAPPELWARIKANIDETPETPETRETSGTSETASEPATAAPANVVDLNARRRGPSWRVVAPIAAAAAVIIGLLAYQVVDLHRQVDNATATGPVASQALFARASKVPGARLATLTGNGAAVARIVVLPDGTGYMINDGLAPLDASQTYQLWALVGDAKKPTAISAGVLGPHPIAAPFKVSGPVVGFALTAEQAGGVQSSQHQPLAQARLS
jgi:anti-sigma factor RsiW